MTDRKRDQPPAIKKDTPSSSERTEEPGSPSDSSFSFSSSKISSDWQQDLQANIERLQKVFAFPINQDLTIRQIYSPSIQRLCAIVSLIGMVDKAKIEEMVLYPLLETRELNQERRETSFPSPLTYLSREVIPLHEVQEVSSVKQGVDTLLEGMTLLLVDGEKQALSLSTTFFDHRQVEKPQNETVLKGPLEGFVESLEVNRSLIRKTLRDERLVAEELRVGERKRDKVSLMYIKGLANPDLIQQVRQRVKEVPVESLQNLALLEQFIEERTYSLIPSLLYTERPDRAVSFLQEGYVVLLMNGSPACLVAPVTFWSYFHTAEDQYERWPYGNFIRLLRLFALFVALFTPALYVAVTNYHIEMLPTDLLMSIAATREQVPFPGIIEVVLMEISFELLREAGVRVPHPIGPTIGIVGALILGEAAVQANIVSPILVIVVALTGLASFIIPDVSLNFAVRITRFLFLAAALVLGLFGIAVFLVIVVGYASSVKSFGVTFFTPIAPHAPASSDTVVRAAVWKQWLRPSFVKPLDPQQIPPSAVQGRRRKQRQRP